MSEDYEQQIETLIRIIHTLTRKILGEFRATKDIDLVLIIEAITSEFGKHF